jgi:hypothetical protein
MRYVLTTVFVCAVGMPVASALPTVSSNSLSASKGNPIVQVANRRHSRSTGGIHPLVGSGEYQIGREANRASIVARAVQLGHRSIKTESKFVFQGADVAASTPFVKRLEVCKHA